MSGVISEKDKKVSYKGTDVFYVIYKATALVVDKNYFYFIKDNESSSILLPSLL